MISPHPNAWGWNNAKVTVSFVCTDEDSGIESCSGPVVLDQEGTDQRVMGHAIDRAGHTAQALVIVNIDKTAPRLTARLDPVPNAAGWMNVATTVTFDATDSLSGVVAFTPPVRLETEGGGQKVRGGAYDHAGNLTSLDVQVSIDLTPPAVT